MTPGSSSKNKGSAGEREVAKLLGTRRTPLSGGAGGNDLLTPPPPFDVWGFEVKRRKKGIAFLNNALAQAEGALGLGSPLSPAVLHRGDHEPWLFTARLTEVITWAGALHEIGGKHHLRELVREMKRSLAALDEAI